MDTFVIDAPDVPTAWVWAVRRLAEMRGRQAFHTVVRIRDPFRDDEELHASLDEVLSRLDLQPLETVANTIFPADIAATSRDHAHLVSRYRDMYANVKRLSPHKNKWGTYFGRLVAYPGVQDREPVDQLGAVIASLIKENAHKSAKTARYEMAIAHPLDEQEDQDTAASAAVIHLPGKDSNLVMGAPCLSHCSFQLDRRGTVHAMATYRSHYMVERAYGNYLGLGRLLRYVAEQSRLRAGVLTVVAGYAQIEPGTITRVRPVLTGTAAMFPSRIGS